MVCFKNLLLCFHFLLGAATLVKKAHVEGLELSETEAVTWIENIDQLFPSIRTSIKQIGSQVRQENEITTISGRKYPLTDISQQNQNTSIWNAITRISSNELVAPFFRF